LGQNIGSDTLTVTRLDQNC